MSGRLETATELARRVEDLEILAAAQAREIADLRRHNEQLRETVAALLRPSRF